MSLFQRISATAMVFTLLLACNIVHAQDLDLKNPEPKIPDTADFINASFDQGQTRDEANPKSSETNISERIDFIQAAFDKGQTSAVVWSDAWTVINGATAGIQTYQAIRSSHNRAYNIVGASGSFLGLAVMIVDPFHASSSGDDLRKLPGGTPEELKNKLDKAENWLERNYKQEKLGRSWLSHLGACSKFHWGRGRMAL